ncbi:MAG: GNAT family N-acetyltransferase [Acidobacteria bacterium]|nr:MAG: GNAT family N-acetyltransferase [Acidobacteriota bacterium]
MARRDDGERPRPRPGPVPLDAGCGARPPGRAVTDPGDPRAAGAFSLRRAGVADAEGIHAVHTASIRSLCRGFYTDAQIETWTGVLVPERYRLVLEDTGRQVWVAQGPEGLAGFGQLNPVSRELEALYVHPDHAGSGVGRALLCHLEGLAKESGAGALRLTATLNAVPFYERMGWVVAGRGTHTHPSGLALACAFMTRDLRAREVTAPGA